MGQKHCSAGKSVFIASKGQISNYNILSIPPGNVSCLWHLPYFRSFVLQHRLSQEGLPKLQQRWQACALYLPADTRSICSYWPRRQDSDIYTAASQKSLSWDRQSEDKNAWVVLTRPFTAWQTPPCKVERAAVARCHQHHQQQPCTLPPVTPERASQNWHQHRLAGWGGIGLFA